MNIPIRENYIIYNSFFQKWLKKGFRVTDIIDDSFRAQFFIEDMADCLLNDWEKSIYQNIDFIFTSCNQEFIGILDKKFVFVLNSQRNISFLCGCWQKLPFSILEEKADILEYEKYLNQEFNSKLQYDGIKGNYIGIQNDIDDCKIYIEEKYGKFPEKTHFWI